MTNGNNEIIIANRNGRAIRFHEAAVRVMGRTATGVRGITLDNDGQDEVVGMICIKDLETESVMVVSEQGYGKRSEIEDYRKTNSDTRLIDNHQVIFIGYRLDCYQLTCLFGNIHVFTPLPPRFVLR